MGTDKPYSPKDLTLALDIGDSTLRKWCIALEEEGLYFSRTDNNRRVFFERDLVVLRHFQKLVQVQNLSMQNAAKIVASKFRDMPSEQENTDNAVPAIRYDNNTMNKVFDEIEQLKELNKQLLKRLDEQQNYIEERMNKRDTLLMESIRETQETKRLIAAAQEKEKEEKNNQGFWARLFGK